MRNPRIVQYRGVQKRDRQCKCGRHPDFVVWLVDYAGTISQTEQLWRQRGESYDLFCRECAVKDPRFVLTYLEAGIAE